MKILLCAGDRTDKVVKYLIENRKSSIDIDTQPSILEGINAINERGMIYDKLVLFGYTFDKYDENQLDKIFINLSNLAKDLTSTQEIVIFAARGNKDNNISKMYHRHLVNFSCVRFDARDAIKASAIEGIIVGSKTVEVSDNIDTAMKQHKAQRSEPLRPGISNPQLTSQPSKQQSRGFLGFGKKSAVMQPQEAPKQIRGSADDLSKLDTADLDTSKASRVGQATGRRRMSLQEKQAAYKRMQKSSGQDTESNKMRPDISQNDGVNRDSESDMRSVLNQRNIDLSRLVDNQVSDDFESPILQNSDKGVNRKSSAPFGPDYEADFEDDLSGFEDTSSGPEINNEVPLNQPQGKSQEGYSAGRNRYLEDADFSDIEKHNKSANDFIDVALSDPNLIPSVKQASPGMNKLGYESVSDVQTQEIPTARQGYGPHDFDTIKTDPQYRYGESQRGQFDRAQPDFEFDEAPRSAMGVPKVTPQATSQDVARVASQSSLLNRVPSVSRSTQDTDSTKSSSTANVSQNRPVSAPNRNQKPNAQVNSQEIVKPQPQQGNSNTRANPKSQGNTVQSNAGSSKPSKQVGAAQSMNNQGVSSRNPFSKATALLGGVKQLTNNLSRGRTDTNDRGSMAMSVSNEQSSGKQVVGFNGTQVQEAVNAYSVSRGKTKLAGNFPDLAKCSEMQKRAHTFFITGDRRSGKSGTTANLGMIGATAGLHTLVIDLDLKGRGMCLYFPQDLNPEDNIYTASISNALRSPHMIKDYTWEVNPLLDVLGLDLSIDDPDLHIKGLTDQKIQMLLAEAHTKYDLVLVDFPFDMLVQFGTVLTQCDRLAYVTENDVCSLVNIINLISPGVFNASVDYHMFRSKLGFILNRYNPNHTMHESVIEPQNFTLMLNNLVEDGEWAKYPIYGTVEELKTYSKQLDNGMLLCNSKGFDELFFEMLYCMYR